MLLTKRRDTIPAHALKTGSCFAFFQYLVSRMELLNESQSSAEKNSDLRHLASNAGGIVGASVYSLGRGWPTGSAGLVGSSVNADSRSHPKISSMPGLWPLSGVLGFPVAFAGVIGLPSNLSFCGSDGGDAFPLVFGSVCAFCSTPLR